MSNPLTLLKQDLDNPKKRIALVNAVPEWAKTSLNIEKVTRQLWVTITGMEPYQQKKIMEVAETEHGRNTILRSVESALALGLDIGNKALGQAYLVPRGQKTPQGWTNVCTMQIGYKGLVKLGKQHAGVEWINCEVVHKDEVFDANFATGEITHKFNPTVNRMEEQDYVAAYAIARIKGVDGVVPHIMGATQILERKMASPAAKKGNGVWAWADVAWKKTVLRGLFQSGKLQIDSVLADAIAADDLIDNEDAQGEQIAERAEVINVISKIEEAESEDEIEVEALEDNAEDLESAIESFETESDLREPTGVATSPPLPVHDRHGEVAIPAVPPEDTEAPETPPEPPKRKRGRPKGSKDKKPRKRRGSAQASAEAETTPAPEPAPKATAPKTRMKSFEDALKSAPDMERLVETAENVKATADAGEITEAESAELRKVFLARKADLLEAIL